MTQTLLKHIALGITTLMAFGLGCDSDYTLDQSTPPIIGEATPSGGGEDTPPLNEGTPTEALPTPEPGWWLEALKVEPAMVDFGDIYPGCGAFDEITVTNIGTFPVVLDSVRLVGLPESLTVFTETEITSLEPGEAGIVLVAAEGKALGVDSLALQFYLEGAPSAAAQVEVLGEVVDPVIDVKDSHYQESITDVDVLWVIDNSGSMGDNQEAIAEEFDKFLSSFLPLGIRYHMGVVTTDAYDLQDLGKMRGKYGASDQPYIDWTMREPGAEEFSNTIKGLGTSGSASERGLQAMDLAFSDENLAGHNYGFLREEARLAVVFVSDEDDQSPLSSTTSDYHTRYLDRLVELKGTLDTVVCSSIINLQSPEGYLGMARDSGGVVASILDDFGEILLEVGKVSAGVSTSFNLSEEPQAEGQITVTINGQEVPEGEDTWTYDPETGAIVFSDGSAPTEGDLVDISYAADASCDD